MVGDPAAAKPKFSLAGTGRFLVCASASVAVMHIASVASISDAVLVAFVGIGVPV